MNVWGRVFWVRWSGQCKGPEVLTKTKNLLHLRIIIITTTIIIITNNSLYLCRGRFLHVWAKGGPGSTNQTPTVGSGPGQQALPTLTPPREKEQALVSPHVPKWPPKVFTSVLKISTSFHPPSQKLLLI